VIYKSCEITPARCKIRNTFPKRNVPQVASRDFERQSLGMSSRKKSYCLKCGRFVLVRATIGKPCALPKKHMYVPSENVSSWLLGVNPLWLLEASYLPMAWTMSANRRAMFLVNSSSMPGSRYKTGEEIPASGVYHVTHSAHRLPHEVMLLRGERFPKCQQCSGTVTFRLLRAATESSRDEKRLKFNVALYELPVLGDDDIAVQTAI
jgi:hypothetical protein